MSKKFYILVIFVLLGINIFILVKFYQYKRQNIQYTDALLHEPDELNALRVNFSTEIKNSNIRLENSKVRDSLNSMIPLQIFFRKEQNNLLVCRFSELNCESCVNYSIRMLLQHVDLIGKDNILFLGAYRNNKVFNRQKPSYGIDTLNTVNTATLNLPAEELGYPYYFILDKTLSISNVFVPDKSAPDLTNRYLKTIGNRYFMNSNSIKK